MEFLKVEAGASKRVLDVVHDTFLERDLVARLVGVHKFPQLAGIFGFFL